jgi:hypothetical protein
VLTITNIDGTEVYRKQNPVNNHFYQDTISLETGCYQLKLTDAGGDGLSFFASSQGNGSIFLKEVITGKSVKNFQKDFGAEISYEFTVNWPLGVNVVGTNSKPVVYPNPTEGLIYVAGLQPAVKITIELYDASGRLLKPVVHGAGTDRLSIELPGKSRGLYMLKIVQDTEVTVERIIRH